jgi:hypothetical protein
MSRFIFVGTRQWKTGRFRQNGGEVCFPQARNLCNTRIGWVMRNVMSDAGNFHTNLAPSQSSTLKVSLRFQKHQCRITIGHACNVQRYTNPNETGHLTNKVRIQRWSQSTDWLTDLRVPLFPVHTHTHTHTSKSGGTHCVSPGLFLQFMTPASRRGTLYWQICSPVQNILTYNAYVNTFQQPVWYIAFFNSSFRLSSFNSRMFND